MWCGLIGVFTVTKQVSLSFSPQLFYIIFTQLDTALDLYCCVRSLAPLLGLLHVFSGMALGLDDMKKIKLRVFEISDLVGKNLDIKSFENGHLELIVAIDTETGNSYTLEQIRQEDEPKAGNMQGKFGLCVASTEWDDKDADPIGDILRAKNYAKVEALNLPARCDNSHIMDAGFFMDSLTTILEIEKDLRIAEQTLAAGLRHVSSVRDEAWSEGRPKK